MAHITGEGDRIGIMPKEPRIIWMDTERKESQMRNCIAWNMKIFFYRSKMSYRQENTSIFLFLNEKKSLAVSYGDVCTQNEGFLLKKKVRKKVC